MAGAGRNEKDGPYVYYNNEGALIRDTSPGGCGAHGPQHNIPVTVRNADHPIMQGLPEQWLTANDECYAKLRGPAENMTILATGKDSSPKPPTNRHEPLLMVLNFGEGRNLSHHSRPRYPGLRMRRLHHHLPARNGVGRDRKCDHPGARRFPDGKRNPSVGHLS